MEVFCLYRKLIAYALKIAHFLMGIATTREGPYTYTLYLIPMYMTLIFKIIMLFLIKEYLIIINLVIIHCLKEGLFIMNQTILMLVKRLYFS